MFSLAITTYKRAYQVLELLEKVYLFKEITEIVIVDDCSGDYDILKTHLQGFEKVKLYRNDKNLGCFLNKIEAVNKCTQEWVILFDSDNKFGREYIEAAKKNVGLGYNVIAPCKAGNFDFTKYIGNITAKDLKRIKNDGLLEVCLNTCNYVVNRKAFCNYVNIDLDKTKQVGGVDSLYLAVEWLKRGNSIHVARGMVYEHPTSPDSWYLQNEHINNDCRTQILNSI